MFQKRQGGLQANGDDPSPGDLFQEVDLEDQQGQEDDRLGPKKPQKKMPSRAEISIVLSNDNLINKLKKEFFNTDEYSDVIAFRLNDYSNSNIEGEVYVSVQRVFENAEKYNEKKSKEISRVLIHGVLHLLDYKDKSKKEKNIMTKKENQYLNMVNWESIYA